GWGIGCGRRRGRLICRSLAVAVLVRRSLAVAVLVWLCRSLAAVVLVGRSFAAVVLAVEECGDVITGRVAGDGQRPDDHGKDARGGNNPAACFLSAARFGTPGSGGLWRAGRFLLFVARADRRAFF